MKTELTAWQLTNDHAGMILSWRKKSRLRTGTIGRVTRHGSDENCYVHIELRNPTELAVLAGSELVHVHP
ncbi:hypothetical protein [Nocardia sp. NPDC127526]|uniref:hypothetical protein n=1 Tax=Nocardia sp. NPDC127526 TaxID=3345393 RepID=UPI003626A29B